MATRRTGLGKGKGQGYSNIIRGYDKKVHTDSGKGIKQPQRIPFVPTPIKYKKYKCSKCGFEKEIDTNHYGDCYSFGHVNTCPNCPPYAKSSEFGGSTTWQCMEKAPKPENIPEKWKKDNLKDTIKNKIDKQKYGKYLIGDLRKTFKEHQNKEHWKNPVDAIVKTKDEAEKLATAIRFFQADVPEIKTITIPYRHKEGLVTMQQTAYHVVSNGYQAD